MLKFKLINDRCFFLKLHLDVSRKMLFNIIRIMYFDEKKKPFLLIFITMH